MYIDVALDEQFQTNIVHDIDAHIAEMKSTNHANVGTATLIRSLAYNVIAWDNWNKNISGIICGIVVKSVPRGIAQTDVPLATGASGTGGVNVAVDSD